MSLNEEGFKPALLQQPYLNTSWPFLSISKNSRFWWCWVWMVPTMAISQASQISTSSLVWKALYCAFTTPNSNHSIFLKVRKMPCTWPNPRTYHFFFDVFLKKQLYGRLMASLGIRWFGRISLMKKNGKTSRMLETTIGGRRSKRVWRRHKVVSGRVSCNLPYKTKHYLSQPWMEQRQKRKIEHTEAKIHWRDNLDTPLNTIGSRCDSPRS